MIKWIVGYIDCYSKIHYKVVKINDSIDSHNQIWFHAHHGKWRWMPGKPKEINSYNEEIAEENLEKIWKIIDDNK